tara:strand:- start:3241 stop:3876 length:636 start_codon:yes stop_codon:yes gene_type:complete
MSDLNAYILSYKGNEKMATRLKRQLTEKGFPSVKIVYAPDMAESGMRRNRVVYHTFHKYLLPEMMKSDKDVIYFEDDADIYSPYSKYKELASKAPMNRIAWWKKVMAKGKIDYLVGSTIISFKKSFLPTLKERMDKTREQHIDGFFTKKFKEGDEWIFEPDFGYGGTVSHDSYIMKDEFRKGQTGSDAPSGYSVPEVKAGFKKGVKADGDK